MGSRSRIELARALAMIALGGATVYQLVGIQSRSAGRFAADMPARTAAAAPARTAAEAADVVVAELRRTDGSGLLAAAANAIQLRVPAAAGVVCATDADRTLVAVLPASAHALEDAAGAAFGWQDDAGAFVVRDERVRIRAAAPSPCAAAAIAVPAGYVFLAVSPAASTARVGGAAVLFERVAYEFRASASRPGALALWREADGASEELLSPVEAGAGFRFFVDAASAPTTAVPAPLARVHGVELYLPRSARDRAAATVAAHSTSVFFRSSAS